MQLSSKLDEYLSKEEDLSRQKSREVWLNKGDRIKKKIKIIRVLSIEGEKRINRMESMGGTWLNSREDIGIEFAINLKAS